VLDENFVYFLTLFKSFNEQEIVKQEKMILNQENMLALKSRGV